MTHGRNCQESVFCPPNLIFLLQGGLEGGPKGTYYFQYNQPNVFDEWIDPWVLTHILAKNKHPLFLAHLFWFLDREEQGNC